MINRTITKQLEDDLELNEIHLLFGARQTGKTSIMKLLKSRLGDDQTLYLNADEERTRSLLDSATSIQYLQNIIGDYKYIIIDEAQRVENIGLCLKLIYDNIPNCKIFATGSSSFQLKNKLSDSLTGRKLEYCLFPLSIAELREYYGSYRLIGELETLLIYGSYPKIVCSDIKFKKRLLDNLCDSYLYKDILQYEGIQKPAKITKLLEALAYQIAQQVSFRELASLIEMDVKTVEKYINILEKSFVIFGLPSFSKNNRNELKFAKKFYFYDLGIRNSIINDYRPINIRKDKGQIWENFIVSERLKKNSYNFNEKKLYFWRTKDQAEIDLLEISNDNIEAFEIKYNESNVAAPKSFLSSYPNTKFSVVNQSNFLEFFNQSLF